MRLYRVEALEVEQGIDEARGCGIAVIDCDEVSAKEPKAAFDLEHAAAAKLEKVGVRIVKDVDKSGFQAISNPLLDKLAKDLGPHAEKVKDLIRASK